MVVLCIAVSLSRRTNTHLHSPEIESLASTQSLVVGLDMKLALAVLLGEKEFREFQ